MTKRELREIIKEDKQIYYGKVNLSYFYKKITRYPYFEIGKYIIISRKAGYYRNNIKGIFSIILCCYYNRKKNKLGQKLNIEVGLNEFGRRLRIFHGNVVINGYAKIGDDCRLYGSNCIGNKGDNDKFYEAPEIGNNVSIGVGTKIIGKIKINDNIIISSMSLVNKDLLDSNCIYAGIPAKKIEK